jgi:hypothetical protein
MKRNPTAESPNGNGSFWFVGANPLHWGRGRICSAIRDGGTMRPSRVELKATQQFDCGRWKLRLERAPFSAEKQTPIG